MPSWNELSFCLLNPLRTYVKVGLEVDCPFEIDQLEEEFFPYSLKKRLFSSLFKEDLTPLLQKEHHRSTLPQGLMLEALVLELKQQEKKIQDLLIRLELSKKELFSHSLEKKGTLFWLSPKGLLAEEPYTLKNFLRQFPKFLYYLIHFPTLPRYLHFLEETSIEWPLSLDPQIVLEELETFYEVAKTNPLPCLEKNLESKYLDPIFSLFTLDSSLLQTHKESTLKSLYQFL